MGSAPTPRLRRPPSFPPHQHGACHRPTPRLGAWVLVIAGWLALGTVPAQEPPDTNYDESKVPAYELPDPLTSRDGTPVRTVRDWRERRRPEILEAFSRSVYGHTPSIETRLVVTRNAPDTPVFQGLARRRQLRLRFFDDETAPWIDLLLYVPLRIQGPVPVFLGLNYGNQGVDPDPGIRPSRNAISRPGEHAHRWPLETVLKRGYAVACFHGGDIELDRHGSGCRFTEDGARQGIRHEALRRQGRAGFAPDDWGSLGAWAWGLSRTLDFLRTDPALDGSRVVVFGHSRTAKAALWAGAQDERVALVIANNSGQGGAALARRRYGETVAASWMLSGSWYCPNYAAFGNNEAALPVDAHLLISLIAPRPVYVASAIEDRWADPRGEFLAARHARPVYELLGQPGLDATDMPAVDQPIGRTVGYHVRSGDHEITAYDWARFLDFADRHLPAPEPRVHLVHQEAPRITQVAPGIHLVDFERVAFGNLLLTPPDASPHVVTIHFGEALENGRVLRTPPGSVRYARVSIPLEPGQPRVAAPPPDRRNTEVDNPRHPPAVLTPPSWGVVLPFRWVEIEGWPGDPEPRQIVRQVAFTRTWSDASATFHCSDTLLNRIWELCRYSIKATTFAGIYVDGDRERIAYEADAHVTQLSHYATDHDPATARSTFDWLMKNPTWPTEWASYMILMAHADWMHTGDPTWLMPRYEGLKDRLLAHRARPDGLIDSGPNSLRRLDLVDWPPGERDGFVFTKLNTVVNATHLRALSLMSELATALDKPDEAADYRARERTARAAFLDRLWDPKRGLFRDGEGTDHASAHANLFSLAFGLVPESARPGVAAWLAQRGMACSVFAAQYLLEGLFTHGAETQALALITAEGDRSWRHMVESGTTITWEAWDQRYKPNLDYNHAWGAAPANLFPRFILGAVPLQPGWHSVRIRPHLAGLEFAQGKIPSPRGPIDVAWERGPAFRLRLQLPDGVAAQVELPAPNETAQVVSVEANTHRRRAARREGDRWILAEPITGSATLEVRATR